MWVNLEKEKKEPRDENKATYDAKAQRERDKLRLSFIRSQM
jgi:hypothetical protein